MLCFEENDPNSWRFQVDGLVKGYNMLDGTVLVKALLGVWQGLKSLISGFIS